MADNKPPKGIDSGEFEKVREDQNELRRDLNTVRGSVDEMGQKVKETGDQVQELSGNLDRVGGMIEKVLGHIESEQVEKERRDRLNSGAGYAPPGIEEMTILRDPFDEQNPHDFLAHPPGFKLGWINPRYRETRNMRGWIPIQYDDEIGKHLDQYIHAAPPRMSNAVDNIVRRGDVMLCRLPNEIWEARQQKRILKAMRGTKAYEAYIQNDSPNQRGNFRELGEPVLAANERHLGGRQLHDPGSPDE